MKKEDIQLKRLIGVPGLYEFLIEKMIPIIIEIKEIKKVLDLGAGSGAFIELLSERWKNWQIAAADLELFESFKLKESIPFYNVNLNSNFSKKIKDKFDLIFSIEVIEHLENPRHFLRECYELLNPNGVLLLTTPNIEAIPVRMRFFIYGNFKFFEPNSSYSDQTHITPIQSDIFKKAAIDSNFKIFMRFQYPENNNFFCSKKITNFAAKLIAPFIKGMKFGDINIFLLQK